MRERIFGGTEWSFADKHNWARRGVLVAHAGFVIIAAGTTLYWARGFSGEMPVLTGETVEVPRTHALLRLDGFSYKIAPIMTKSGMVYQPIDYVSRVTVTGNDGVPKSMTVRVNHPIDVDGTLYYQASYGFGMQFRVTRAGQADRTLSNANAAGGRHIRFARNAENAALRALRSDRRQTERHADAPIRASTTRGRARRFRGGRSTGRGAGAARHVRSISAAAGASCRNDTCCTAAFNTATIPAFRSSESARSCCWPGW